MKYSIQTVLYKTKKGKQPWELKAEFLKALREAFETLDGEEHNAVKVPFQDVLRAISGEVNATPKSIALQIGRKYGDISAVAVGENIIFRPRR